MSPKRSHGDDGEEGKPKVVQKVTVLELKDMQKEYQLILARLQLIQEADPMNILGTLAYYLTSSNDLAMPPRDLVVQK